MNTADQHTQRAQRHCQIKGITHSGIEMSLAYFTVGEELTLTEAAEYKATIVDTLVSKGEFTSPSGRITLCTHPDSWLALIITVS